MATLKNFFSKKAGTHRRVFEKAALTVIGTHVGATICAAVALSITDHGDTIHFGLVALLISELGLLVWGFRRHHRLLHEKHAREWAGDRMGAEIARSARRLVRTHLHLSHLFRLRMRQEPGWRALLTTLNLLHLRSTRPHANRPVKKLAKSYVRARLIFERPNLKPTGQIPYYERTRDEARSALRRLNGAFAACVTFAIVATTAKLIAICADPQGHGRAAVLGAMAVVFPVLAVGALSWANALDYQARATINDDMVRVLERQRAAIERCTDLRELRRLILETENALFTEVSEWHARRAVIGP